MNISRKLLLALTCAWVPVAAVACDDGDNGLVDPIVDTVTVTDTVVTTDTVRIGNASLSFNQIERLGNPLVSEVFLDKRLHGFFNSTNPSTDQANFQSDLTDFVTGVAGRNQATADMIAGLLLPDMLMIFPNRAAGVSAAGVDDSGVVGWLTWALAPGEGYGGRKLDNDDAVDKGLAAIFGSLLSSENVSPGLATDNVTGAPDPDEFPYVAAGN